eukprot:GHVT01102534.1.p1 GENE.GHVT01102534.1~~GHVT01102534.1.p1  ORF type:complete len:261 (+),score=31.82 GHVT01102534.1:1152-1934(+)
MTSYSQHHLGGGAQDRGEGSSKGYAPSFAASYPSSATASSSAPEESSSMPSASPVALPPGVSAMSSRSGFGASPMYPLTSSATAASNASSWNQEQHASSTWTSSSPSNRHGHADRSGILSLLYQRIFLQSLRSRWWMPWMGFALMILGFWIWASDGSFSALVVLGSAFQFFAYLLLAFKIFSQNSVQGLSIKSIALSALALLCRLYTNLQFEGYLPLDKSGDWLYQVIDSLSALLAVAIVGATLLGNQKLRDTYQVFYTH